MICAAFYKGQGDWLDRVIRTTTASPYSHCELVAESVLPGRSARSVSASWRDGGVRAKVITFDHGKWDVVPLPWAWPSAFTKAETEVGAGYHLIGATLSILPAFAGPSKSRWFCSELVAWALGLDRPEAFYPGSLARHLRDMNRAFDMGLYAP